MEHEQAEPVSHYDDEVDRYIFKDHHDYAKYQKTIQDQVAKIQLEQINSKPKFTKIELYKQKLKERYNLDEMKQISQPQIGLGQNVNNVNNA